MVSPSSSPAAHRRRYRGAFSTFVFLSALVPRTAWSEVPQNDADAVERARWLKNRGHLEEAKELLSRWTELMPKSELLATARAELYLAEDNPFWALKVLGEFMDGHGPACQARALSARIQITQANLDQAEALLSEPGCDKPEALRVRQLLLRAEIAELRGNSLSARQLVEQAQSIRSRYEEDDARLAVLERAYEPHRLPWWTSSIDVGIGYVTTGLGQAPLEVVAPSRPKDSAVTSMHLLGRVVLPWKPAFRPMAELEFKGFEQLTNTSRSLSYRQPTLRLGALLGRGLPRLQLNYAFDIASFANTPSGEWSHDWYSLAHRGEYRLDLGRGFVGFGSAGYRQFFDHRLSRFESEHGVFKQFALSETLAANSGALTRAHKADFHVFDQMGLLGFVGLSVQAPKGFELRESLSLSHDRFPASARFFAPQSAARKDWMLRVGATLLTPEFSGARFALSYDYSSRDSNVNAYDFKDHRAFLELQFRLSHDDVRASRIAVKGRVPMHHEKETPKAVEPETQSVRDALRKDEELRRGSSCLK